jgi:hypothetical protein
MHRTQFEKRAQSFVPRNKPDSPGAGPSRMGGTSQSNIVTAESQEIFLRIPRRMLEVMGFLFCKLE